MIHDLIRQALANAKENGYETELRTQSLAEQVSDLQSCDAELEKFLFRDIFAALLDVYLETAPFYFLNKMQFENRKHRLLDPIHAIQFALHNHSGEGLEFLKCWNEGDWESCAKHWPEWRTFTI